MPKPVKSTVIGQTRYELFETNSGGEVSVENVNPKPDQRPYYFQAFRDFDRALIVYDERVAMDLKADHPWLKQEK